jgi:hypothetical protein
MISLPGKMQPFRALLPVIVSLLPFFTASCTMMVPKEKIPPPLVNESFSDPAKLVAIPLPVIASSPNEDVTLGGLTAFLLHNRRDEVETLMAPQVNYNRNFGTTFSLYGVSYPSSSSSVEFNLSRSTNVNEDYELRYIRKGLFDKRLELNLFSYYFTDGSARFFGFQSQSRQQDETNYGDREGGFNFTGSWVLGQHYRLLLGERFRNVNVVRGAIENLPYIGDRFTPEEVPGIDGFTTHAQRIALVYSTLNSESIPTFGGYVRIGAENSSTFLGSSSNFRHLDLEVKGFIPKLDARSITAFRIAWNQTSGGGTPFLEQSILGGETTLRGYGRNRFVDRSYVLLNLEERFRLFRWEIFDVTADWEVAPFIDVGTVMKSFDEISSHTLAFNPGIGFRAMAPPNIIGWVDVGFGDEGPAVFVGLGYPF